MSKSKNLVALLLHKGPRDRQRQVQVLANWEHIHNRPYQLVLLVKKVQQEIKTALFENMWLEI